MSLLLALTGGVSPDVTVSITGVQSVASVGTLSPSTVVSASGNQASTATGTVALALTVPMSGNSAAGQVGIVSTATDGTQQDTHDPGSYVQQYKRKEPWKDERRAELRKQLQVALGFLTEDASRDQESKALVEEVTAQYAKADAVPQNTREFIIDYDAIMTNIEYVQRIIDLYVIRKKRHALAILLLLGV